jgi:hypothetical protein
MKKSNYLVILFAIFILGGIFLNIKPEFKSVSMIRHTIKLNHFSVIVAQPGSKIVLQEQFSGGEFPTFTYFSEEGEQFKSPSFGVRNDTLFVFPSSSEKDYSNDSFYCPGIKSIVGLERSNIRLGHFQIDSLVIKLRYAKLSGDLDLSYKKPRMLTIDADSSKIVFRNYMYNYNQINIRLNRSHLSMLVARKDTGLITGSLKNYSRLSIDEGRPRVHVITDETSFNFLAGTSIASAQFPKF